MAFDISQFETLDTKTFGLKKPNGDDLEVGGEQVTVELYGSGSKQFISAKYKRDNLASQRAMNAMRNGKNAIDAEASRKEDIEFLVACTKGFSANWGASASETYSNPKLNYIFNQVDKLLGDDANFMAG